MAQQDTGLGWSAKEEWLLYGGSAVVATLNDYRAVGYPNQPLPYTPTVNDVQSGGLYIGYTGNQTQATGREIYVGVKTENVVVFVTTYTTPSGNKFFGFFSPSETYTLIYANKRYNQWFRDGEVNVTGVIDPTTGLYFYGGWGHSSSGVDGYSEDVIPYADAADVIIAQSANYYKVNEGYAVACLARWKTPNGTILESPILISTDSEAVEMSTDQTGVYFAKLNLMYNGRRFYMGFYDRIYTGTMTTTLQIMDRSYSDAPTFTLEQLFKYIAKDVYANILITNSPDPYQEEDGESGEDGGNGEDDESDEIPFTDAPVSGIAYSGFLTIFTPNLSQLQSLANYMWSDFFDVDTWKKLFANPMDAILGLHIIPCSPGYSGNKEVKVGGKGTGVSMDYTTIRYHEVSMGTCSVPKKWGSYLDYNPYTKISIFLPYIGFRDLDTDDVMNRTLALQYIVDILTGACVAELRCGTDVLYSWEGNCANPVPITSNSWSSAIGSAVNIAAAIATTALTHGASAPMIAGTVASVGANSMNLKPSVSRSGSLGGSGGFIAKQTPYIIRTVPNLVIPADQNKFIGYPSFVTTSLGSLTGYNEISSIHLEGIPATGNELTEIETLLKGGVIF